MAEKKPPMGDDPLAWLANDGDKTAEKIMVNPKKRTRKRAIAKKPAKVKTEIKLVEDSFAALAPQGAQLATRFYERLFEQYPAAAPLFDGVSLAGQEKKLLASLVLLVQNLHKPEVLKDYLMGLGARHVHYGVTEKHYPMVTETLLAVMEEFAGDLWTPDVQQAWENTLNTVVTIMLDAYQPVEADETAVNEQSVADQQNSIRMQAAVDGAMTAIMMIDRDFNVTYVNHAIVTMLSPYVDTLKEVFPGFSLENLMATNIDDFHEVPSKHKAILQDINNMPYNTQIQLLDLHFDLTFTALLDSDGNQMGNMIECKDITDQVNAENAIQALISAAGAGQLEKRINAKSYNGFMKNVADGINSIMDAVLMPVQETIRVAQALSEGDLTRNLEGEYSGMFADLADALNSTVNKLAETVAEINDSSNAISSGATEISEGNIDLSHRTEQQASSLEETASSMKELTSTVRQNSDNARQANQLAAGACEQAEKGSLVIKQAIEAMAEISTSSKKVTDIIGVIDEVAFQTNLLALNAAVEAARAGKQGRGFAVIASEVRNLAQRSASAAKEIKELINDSGESVKEGFMLVDESGRTLEEIVTSAKKIGDIVSEIAAAGAEQMQGIEQINKTVIQIDEMAQQNSALVEQATAASESLDDQGKNLQRLMSFFTTGGEKIAPTPKKGTGEVIANG